MGIVYLVRLATVAVLLLLASGCGSQKPSLNPVHGKVYYKGAALARGTIVFTPDSSRGHRGELALGQIQADGSYSLRTGNAYGASPGWYRVTVLAVEMPDKPAAGQLFVIPQSLLPEKYRDPELAGLVRQVLDGQENGIDFYLD